MFNEIFMDFENMEPEQAQSLPLIDFEMLDEKSMSKFRSMYPDVYNRLQAESEAKNNRNPKQLQKNDSVTQNEKPITHKKYRTSNPKLDKEAFDKAMETKKLVIKNIKSLVRTKGLKLSDIEGKLGFINGYFSRHTDSDSDIPFCKVLMCAYLLEVDLNDLVNVDIAKRKEIEKVNNEIDALLKRRKELLEDG